MEDQVRFFSALSSEPRISILLLLKEHPQCVNAIAERLRMSQPAVSQHLRVLKQAGLVKSRKMGSWMHYEVDGKGLASQGKAMARLFGGWVEPQAARSGSANCPPKLLKECHTRKPAKNPAGRPAGKQTKSRKET
jgi:ArsR family transcriptional regulator, arsenate/arsenite/antimonite-responsive transcriptional repressor